MRFFLIRAGSTQWDDYRRLQGRLDIPLSEIGLQQVKRGALIAPIEDVREIHSGFTLSALQTAQIAARIVSKPHKRNQDLDEVDLGMWQGVLESDLKRRHRRLFALWRKSPFSVIPPRGESLEDAYDRVGAAVEEIVSARRGPLAIVLPKMAHRLVQCRLKDKCPDRFFEEESHGFLCESLDI